MATVSKDQIVMLTLYLAMSITNKVSSRITVMLRLFGTNDTSIGKFQPLPKVARLTVMLRNATVNNMVVSKERKRYGICSI